MMDSLPKYSKDQEMLNAQKICEEMREIAKKLPKPSGNVQEKIDGQTQYGNNFYFLFIAIEGVKLNPDLPVVKHYFKKAERLYGEKWKKFLQDNVSLITQIQEALIPVELYFELLSYFNKIFYNPKTRDLAIQVEKEINLKDIGADIWNKLNPLLKQASEAMTLYGIKPEDFYG